MAIAYRKQIDNDTEFALWKIEEQADDLYNQLQLDEDEKAFAGALSHGKRYLHWLGARVLLRMMLHTDEYIDCKVDEHGKPYLVNLPYHISLSHSFDYAAVMISRTSPVGIDIEKIEQKVERIAHKFMQPQEMDFLDEHEKVRQLYTCWCAKEAVYKCFGQKEVSFADNIHVQPFEPKPEGSLKVSLEKGAAINTYEVNYMEYDGYMVGYVKG